MRRRAPARLTRRSTRAASRLLRRTGRRLCGKPVSGFRPFHDAVVRTAVETEAAEVRVRPSEVSATIPTAETTYAQGAGLDEPSSEVVSLGSSVVLEDLDDRTQEEYVLVSPPESNPSQGRLSDESPVGRAISGHHRGDVVDAQAPHTIRHLRIVDLHAGRRMPERPRPERVLARRSRPGST
jgi:transcription elongation GreA/GreB family factor